MSKNPNCIEQTFQGFDHIDTRVPNLRAVEPFYDQLMPALGLSQKRFAYVDERGDWHDASADTNYNTVEYYEPVNRPRIRHFIGFVEDRNMRPTQTRIAFSASSKEKLAEWHDLLRTIGAQKIEMSADMSAYPAIFFEDPAGTKLEICARLPSRPD